jgi:hypothetical protein
MFYSRKLNGVKTAKFYADWIESDRKTASSFRVTRVFLFSHVHINFPAHITIHSLIIGIFSE